MDNYKKIKSIVSSYYHTKIKSEAPKRQRGRWREGEEKKVKEDKYRYVSTYATNYV